MRKWFTLGDGDTGREIKSKPGKVVYTCQEESFKKLVVDWV
jgi:hypothetical protein